MKDFSGHLKRASILLGTIFFCFLLFFVLMVEKTDYVEPETLLPTQTMPSTTSSAERVAMLIEARITTPLVTNTMTATVEPSELVQDRLLISERAQEIYDAGLAAGNNPHTFSTVGDCITAIYPFMVGFDTGEYHLGEYDYLQETVDHFEGAFGQGSQASGNNFTSATVLDPMWTSDRICEAGETPLACEYRLTNPSVAVIMLGTNDVARFGVDVYRDFMVEILDYTIEQSILPVLTTFPTLPNYYATQSERFNDVVMELAHEYEIPLIDLREALVDLPDHGMNRDGLHPSDRGDNFIDFRGDQFRYGMTMRDLLTLQMLDAVIHRDG